MAKDYHTKWYSKQDKQLSVRSLNGKTPKQGQGVYIDPAAVVVGDVELADDVSIWPMVAMRGDVNYIRIGKRTNIQDGSILHVTHEGPFGPGHPLIIGEDVTIGHQAMVHGCTIENNVLIGMNAIILDGAHIPEHVVIAAGSTVPPGKKLESGYLYMGQPAKPTRKLTEKEISYFDYSSKHYINLKNQYLKNEN